MSRVEARAEAAVRPDAAPESNLTPDHASDQALAALGRLCNASWPPLAVFDARSELRHLNRGAQDLFGAAKRLGAAIRPLQDLVREAAADLSGQTPRVTRMLTLERLDRTFQVELSPLPDRTDPLVLAVLTDVTDHVRARRQALGAQNRLSDFVDCASDWLWETDEHGRLTFLSTRLTQIAGRPAQLFLGRRFGDFGRFLTPDVPDLGDAEPFRTHLPFRDFAFELQDRAGAPCQQWISGVPVFDTMTGRFAGYRGTGTDVTQQMAAETALRRSQEQLQHTLEALQRRNEQLFAAAEAAEAGSRAKGQFLAQMSHELRTPLNAIIGFAQILHMEIFGKLGNEQYRQYSSDILTSATHLLELITDILDLSKIEAGRRELARSDVEIEPEIAYCIRLVQESAKSKDITVQVSPHPEVPTVWADRRAVRQMLTNLLMNSVKFTPSGGRIDVDVACDGERIAITVRDTGIGIPPEDVDRLLQPFERGSSSYSRQQDGVGLGLPLTKALAELHGGDMTVNSRLSQGTAVTISLPVHPPASRDAAAKRGGQA